MNITVELCGGEAVRMSGANDMNDLLCAGKCKLTIKDMMEMPRYFYNDDFNLLLKLSKKGMPVKGLTNLRLDERYIYERYDDPLTGESVFKWKPLST